MKPTSVLSYLLLTPLCQAQGPLSPEGALALAAKHRPTLSAARLGVEQARTAARSLAAYPATTFGIGVSTRKDAGATDQDLYVSQPIDVFGRTRASKRAGDAVVQMALAQYRSTASELQSEILGAFADAVTAAQRMEVADGTLVIAAGLLSAAQKKYEQGLAPETQVTRATIEFERSKQALDLSKSESIAASARLRGVLGADAEGLTVDVGARLEPLTNPVLLNRPDLMMLRAQGEADEADAGVASVANRPELDFLLLRSPWGDDPNFVAGRAQLTWKFFDSGKAQNDSSAARQRAQATRSRLQDATAIARAELEVAQIELKARQSRIVGLEAIRTSARSLVAKAQRSYEEGFGTQIEVLEAARGLKEVELDLVEARHQLSLAVISQYRASGFLAEVLK